MYKTLIEVELLVKQGLLIIALITLIMIHC